MKINLAAKNNDIKDNYPSRNFNINFKREENKIYKQEKCIYHNG